GPPPGPPTMDYEEGQPIPPNYRLERRIRKGMLIGGAVTFGSCYLLSVIAAGAAASAANASTKNDFLPLYAPLAGPFIAIGTAGTTGAGTFLLVLDGLGQVGGLALGITGLAWKESLLVRSDTVSFTVTPMVLGKGTMGLGIVGSM